MPPDANASTKTLLLAEDDEVNRSIIAHVLSSRGNIKLVIAVDGKAALEVAMERRFDLMIFDQNMPYIQGDRVIRQLKAGRTINATTPVIQLTADPDLVKVGPGRATLADAVVSKPVRPEELLAVLDRLLGL